MLGTKNVHTLIKSWICWEICWKHKTCSWPITILITPHSMKKRLLGKLAGPLCSHHWLVRERLPLAGPIRGIHLPTWQVLTSTSFEVRFRIISSTKPENSFLINVYLLWKLHFFYHGDLDLWPMTLTPELVRDIEMLYNTSMCAMF